MPANRTRRLLLLCAVITGIGSMTCLVVAVLLLAPAGNDCSGVTVLAGGATACADQHQTSSLLWLGFGAVGVCSGATSFACARRLRAA